MDKVVLIEEKEVSKLLEECIYDFITEMIDPNIEAFDIDLLDKITPIDELFDTYKKDVINEKLNSFKKKKFKYVCQMGSILYAMIYRSDVFIHKNAFHLVAYLNEEYDKILLDNKD
jgi:hypothetical protein